MSPAAINADLDTSINGLRAERPEFSATPTFTRGQVVIFAAIAGLTAALLYAWPRWTGVGLVGIATAWYLAHTVDRCVLMVRGLRRPGLIVIDDDTALGLTDDELPVYTVLLPAFHEPDIVHELLIGVGRLDYPAEKLDIKLLLEADDELTVGAARRGGAAKIAEIVLVPPAEPRTKPKACNYGLLRARGEVVTIYDAEDIPEPLQLRRVVAAFSVLSEDVVCLQGRLAYFNERQNLLTRWFSCEYDQWFGFVLPALSHAGAPIPLGGTSNHIKRAVLTQVGGWDPFNVTEDADLGIRLARQGYRTGILGSVTSEEANSDPVNWVRQRSRWYKGYLQTFLVHTREPRRTWRELGARGSIRFASMMLGTPVANVFNLIFVVAGLLWLAGRPATVSDLLPAPLYFASIISFVFGNAATIYLGIITTRVDGKPYLLLAVLLCPLYWLLMSAAAGKALVQLIVQPSYWEKTVHGLQEREAETEAAIIEVQS